MPWAVAAAAVAAGGAYMQSQAANKAGERSANAANSATGEQAREFNINQQNQAPYLNTGTSALNRLASIYGLNTGQTNYGASLSGQSGSPGTAGYESGTKLGSLAGAGGGNDYSSFFQAPDYQFALGQELQGLDRSAAARGSLYSGGHNADTLRYAEGLASQQFGNYINRLSGLAGIGQGSANQLGAYGQNYANSVGNIAMRNAANQNGYAYDQANAWSNFGNQLAGIGGQYFGNQGGGSSPPPANTGTFTSGNALTGGTFTGGTQNPQTVGWPGMNNTWGQLG